LMRVKEMGKAWNKEHSDISIGAWSIVGVSWHYKSYLGRRI